MHSDPYPNGGHIFLKASFAIFGEAGPLPVTLSHGMFGQGEIPKLFCVQPRKCPQSLGKHVLVFTTTYWDSLVLLCTSRAPVARGLFFSGTWTTGSMFLPPQQCVSGKLCPISGN